MSQSDIDRVNSMERITLVGAPNFRDLAGTPTLDGRVVRPRTIFRSEGPAHFNAEDVGKLANLGIRTVCDLRSRGERDAHPNHWCGNSVLLNIDIPIDVRVEGNQAWDLLRKDPTLRGGRAAMTLNYRSLGRAIEAPFKILIDHLLDQKAVPVLIHCTGGKDRTGVIVALLLHALGVHENLIEEDYVLSSRHAIGPRFESVLRRMFADLGIAEPSPEVIASIAGVESGYLTAALDELRGDHPSLDYFFAERIGLDAQRRAALCEMLLQ